MSASHTHHPSDHSHTDHNHGDHDQHRHAHRSTRASLTLRAALASVSMALCLVLLKAWASWETGSVAMLGSLADSTLDIVASLVTLYSVRLAAQPADHDHRFGHGKAEALAALFQSGIITGSAIAIGWRGLSRIGETSPPDHPELGIGVSLVAMAATLALITYQRMVVKKTGSVAIHADHVHYSSDLLLNAAVIAALVLDSMLGVRGADPLFGVAIAFWLIWHAVAVAREAMAQLMDKEWPADKRDALTLLVEQHPEIRGVHDMRTRTSGAHDFVQFHVWVDPDMTMRTVHKVMDQVEANVLKSFPGVEILIHPDPEGHQPEGIDSHEQDEAAGAIVL